MPKALTASSSFSITTASAIDPRSRAYPQRLTPAGADPLNDIRARIKAGTFDFGEELPDYRFMDTQHEPSASDAGAKSSDSQPTVR
jgi:hypothetical protein